MPSFGANMTAAVKDLALQGNDTSCGRKYDANALGVFDGWAGSGCGVRQLSAVIPFSTRRFSPFQE